MSLARGLWQELRLQQRYGIVYAAVVVVLTWVAVLWLMPGNLRTSLLPFLLIVDTAIFGFFLLPGMMFLEQNDRVLAALVVTPQTTTRYLLNKVTILGGISVALGVSLAVLVPGTVNWLLLIAGVGLGSVMTMLAGFAVATRFSSITQYMLPSAILLTLVQVPGLEYFDLWSSPVLYVVPTMAALVLVEGAVATVPTWEIVYGLVYGLLCCWLALVWARRSFDRFVVGGLHGRQRTREGARGTRPLVRRGRLAALAIADLRNLRRDPLMLFMVCYAALLALIGRWLIPWIMSATADSFDLRPYVILIATFLVVQTGPLILGAITGLVLLDERDEQSLMALRVTPLPLAHYGLYRMAIPTVISFVLCFIGVYFVDLVDAPPLRVAVVALLTALEAPMIGLALASVANNKVEGLALMKSMGVFMFAPAIAWFVVPPWRWLFGIVPTLWPAEAFWQAIEPQGGFWVVAAVGLVTHLGLLRLLVHRFRSRL